MMMRDKIFNACVELGLDAESGKSGYIGVNCIESESGLKITGNGSRIRRDFAPWNLYNIKLFYSGCRLSDTNLLGKNPRENMCNCCAN